MRSADWKIRCQPPSAQAFGDRGEAGALMSRLMAGVKISGRKAWCAGQDIMVSGIREGQDETAVCVQSSFRCRKN